MKTKIKPTNTFVILFFVCAWLNPLCSFAAQNVSLYSGGWKLTDQNETPVGIDVYKGNWVIVSMFYSSCPHSCPLLIETIKKKIEKKVDNKELEQLRVILISFDPKRDTPTKLRKLASDRNIDLTRWKLLTGSENDLEDIAAALGVKVRALPGGDFNHSSIISLLDKNGSIVSTVDGLNEAMEPIVQKLDKSN
jgi:protein SCO1/2